MLQDALQESIVINGACLFLSLSKVVLSLQINFFQPGETVFCSEQLRYWFIFMLVHDLLYILHISSLLLSIYFTNTREYFSNHYLNDDLNLYEYDNNVSIDRESINGHLLSRRALDRNKFSLVLEKFCQV